MAYEADKNCPRILTNCSRRRRAKAGVDRNTSFSERFGRFFRKVRFVRLSKIEARDAWPPGLLASGEGHLYAGVSAFSDCKGGESPDTISLTCEAVPSSIG